jgi:hypothetical protein
LIARERAWLESWRTGCPHTTDIEAELVRFDQGREHTVFFAENRSVVIKVTNSDTYGDFYYMDATGRVCERRSTPAEYLRRLELVRFHFGFTTEVLGVSAGGCIVSRQAYVTGDPPGQEEVDSFLVEKGLEAVKKNCWLWKMHDSRLGVNIWLGDARGENFVKTAEGFVPIDIRMWIT